jgi:hypothetical protein
LLITSNSQLSYYEEKQTLLGVSKIYKLSVPRIKYIERVDF